MTLTDAQLIIAGSMAVVILVLLATRYRGKGFGNTLRWYFLLTAAAIPPVLALVYVAWFEEQEGLGFFTLQGSFKLPFNIVIVVVGAATAVAGFRVWKVLGRRVS
jgi:hypothetical protein